MPHYCTSPHCRLNEFTVVVPAQLQAMHRHAPSHQIVTGCTSLARDGGNSSGFAPFFCAAPTCAYSQLYRGADRVQRNLDCKLFRLVLQSQKLLQRCLGLRGGACGSSLTVRHGGGRGRSSSPVAVPTMVSSFERDERVTASENPEQDGRIIFRTPAQFPPTADTCGRGRIRLPRENLESLRRRD